jgi:superfamily II DNA or RNA helicase
MEEKKVIIGDCVSAYKERAMGKLHIVRCASIKHSQMTAQAFRDSGIVAAHVDGTTPDDEMRQIIRAYARRQIQVLSFCDLLNFGFDLSQASGMDVCIESGSDLKPSMSLAGQMQFWGRMLRYKPAPAIIIDHVNNHEEHGVPCLEREWTLADREQKKRKAGEKREQTKQCENCFYVHAPAPLCPECGYNYPIKPRTVDVVEGHIEEIDKFAALQKKKQARSEQGQAQTLDQLIALGKSRGYQNPRGWAMKVFYSRKR